MQREESVILKSNGSKIKGSAKRWRKQTVRAGANLEVKAVVKIKPTVRRCDDNITLYYFNFSWCFVKDHMNWVAVLDTFIFKAKSTKVLRFAMTKHVTFHPFPDPCLQWHKRPGKYPVDQYNQTWNKVSKKKKKHSLSLSGCWSPDKYFSIIIRCECTSIYRFNNRSVSTFWQMLNIYIHLLRLKVLKIISVQIYGKYW